MTESEYLRFNVASATCTPYYNEVGERKAEIDLLLPSNIGEGLTADDTVYLSLSKLSLPMRRIPIISAPIDVQESARNGLAKSVTLKARIGITCGDFNSTTGEFEQHDPNPSLITPTIPYFKNHADMTSVPLVCFSHHFAETTTSVSKKFEMGQGLHPFYTITELLSCINSTIAAAWSEWYIHEHSYTPIVHEFKTCPHVEFVTNTDNTFSIKVRTISNENLNLPYGSISYRLRDEFSDDIDSQHAYVDVFPKFTTPYLYGDGTHGTEGVFERERRNYYFCGNEELVSLLPTLPWIKVLNVVNNTYRHPGFGEYFYILNTKNTQFKINPKNASMTTDENVSFPIYETDELEYWFDSSDAAASTDIAALALCMNGVTLNQQLYPVNFTYATAAAAVTSSIPIIDVYYPFWETVNNATADLIIVKEAFTNAAPIRAPISILNERSIKFKMVAITKTGEMRELFIPNHSNFCFQIIFQLIRKKPKA